VHYCPCIGASSQSDSRITLSTERDRLGLNRVQLDWRLSPIDKYTIQRSQQIIAQEFERSGLGQLQIELSDDESSWQSVEVRTITSVPRMSINKTRCRQRALSSSRDNNLAASFRLVAFRILRSPFVLWQSGLPITLKLVFRSGQSSFPVRRFAQEEGVGQTISYGEDLGFSRLKLLPLLSCSPTP